jgi:hypothetical protein
VEIIGFVIIYRKRSTALFILLVTTLDRMATAGAAASAFAGATATTVAV